MPRSQVDFDELYSYVKYLGHKCPKKEIEDMIWEVDENGDGCVQWEEFKTMCAAALPPSQSVRQDNSTMFCSRFVCRHHLSHQV